MATILLVEDEASMRLLTCAKLKHQFTIICAKDGVEALELLERQPVDLIIADVMMPRMDGFTTCRLMRERGITCPVIFLSAKGDIVDKGVGFQAGGDDYMVKPFDPRELLMHIEAHLRRAHMDVASAKPEPKTLMLGRFVIDTAKHQVTKEGISIKLTPKEFKILLALARMPDTVLSKEQLVEDAWGAEFVGETQSITVFIKKLRNKIEDDPSDPRIIETVWGIGYRLVEGAC